MPTYEVGLRLSNWTTIEVEADSEEEACQLALSEARHADWDTGCAEYDLDEWKLTTDPGPAKIAHVRGS